MRKSYGRRKPMEEWEVLLKDHHEGYIDWTEFERNQHRIATNAFRKAGGVKSGRGGRALLSGLLTCTRCNGKMSVVYPGRRPTPAYRCDRRLMQHGLERCQASGGSRVDAAIADEIIRVVEPMAIEASLEAERARVEELRERQRLVELNLQQARYEASLAERRYAACDPDNRLIAAQLEKSWEATLQRVQACEARLDAMQSPDRPADMPELAGLAADLKAAWHAPGVTMRSRQRIVRALIADILADVDDEGHNVILTIHWRGGQHSQLRVRKLKSSEHGRRTTDKAVAVIKNMAGRWTDDHIAATLNRMGMHTGQGNTWTATRVRFARRKRGIGCGTCAAVPLRRGNGRPAHRSGARCVRQGAGRLRRAPCFVTSAAETTTRNAPDDRGPLVSLNRRDGSKPLRRRPLKPVTVCRATLPLRLHSESFSTHLTHAAVTFLATAYISAPLERGPRHCSDWPAARPRPP